MEPARYGVGNAPPLVEETLIPENLLRRRLIREGSVGGNQNFFRKKMADVLPQARGRRENSSLFIKKSTSGKPGHRGKKREKRSTPSLSAHRRKFQTIKIARIDGTGPGR